MLDFFFLLRDRFLNLKKNVIEKLKTEKGEKTCVNILKYHHKLFQVPFIFLCDLNFRNRYFVR